LCQKSDVEHLVYASSSSVYGANTKLPFSTLHSVDHPVSMYAATKKSNELMAHCYSHLYKLPTTGLRFFTVYGPWGRPDMAAFLFTQKILAGEPIPVFNHGNHKRDFTFIDDIVEGVIRVTDSPAKPDPDYDPDHPHPGRSNAPYRVYNIGNNSPVLLADFISAIEQAIGKKAIQEMKPMAPGDVVDTFADVSDLESHFGYKPNTSIHEGIRRFVEWYKEYFSTRAS
ncbi:MAG: NAD-dependent epimerase/dehydratase family protein, partial [Bdellovibrionales bacterium]|nr:NAD-dependent epimerase/dehydratase family protein [Bdellovibrionales bacterium]